MAIGLLLLAAVGGIGGVWMLSQFHPRVLEAKMPSAAASLTASNHLDDAYAPSTSQPTFLPSAHQSRTH